MSTNAQELLDQANGLQPTLQNIKIFPIAYKHLQGLEEKARNNILNNFEKKLGVTAELHKKSGQFTLKFKDEDRANKNIVEEKIKKIRNALMNIESLVRSGEPKKIFKRIEGWLSTSEERSALKEERKTQAAAKEFEKATKAEKPLYTKPLKARFPYQQPIIDALNNDRGYTFIEGQAATGKTYLAVRYAVQQLKSGKCKKIVLIRPAVEAGEKLGFLPGVANQKLEPYMYPFFDIMDEIGITRKDILDMMNKGTLEILPLAYARGRTLRNAIVVCDESQNATKAQIQMIEGRLGPKSRVIFTGSKNQQDLQGPQDFLKRMNFIKRNDLGNIIKIPYGVESCRHPEFQKIVEAEMREAAEALQGINHDEDSLSNDLHLENGYSNGHDSNGNGHARGYANGNSNGHFNGHSSNGNGHKNGHMNGNGNGHHLQNGKSLSRIFQSPRNLAYPENHGHLYIDDSVDFSFGHDNENGPHHTPD